MRKFVSLCTGALVVVAGNAFFAGCGSDGGGGSDTGDGGSTTSGDASVPTDGGSAPAQFSLSASVVGLTGSGLVLRDKSGEELAVTAQAGGATQKVTFPTKRAAGTSYEVTVKTQPSSPPQSCVVTGGSGTVVAGDVDSITVNCTTLYTVGGTVKGLAGKDLILQNDGDTVTVNANGQFAFPKPLANGAAYAVTVKQNPTAKWQTCTVTRGDGGADAGASGTIAGANVTDVEVTCVTNQYDLSVDVTGLAGSGLVFQNNGADDLAASANGKHTFATKVESGAGYDVTVPTQPTTPWQTCTVTGGKATMAGANVTLAVACATNKYKVGGTLSGLQGTGLVLQNNAGDDLTLNANGAFSFATTIASGQDYAVTVKTQPTGVAGEVCSVSPATASGTVAGADVASVVVACSTNKKVFVSSATYDGNLGGLAGADAKCQALADAAALPGTYKAWLSDSTGSPSTRFTQSTVPYVLVDGTVVANDWADLVDGTLAHAIDKTELGGAPPVGNTSCAGGGYATVWSATSQSGTLASASLTCSNWTATTGGAYWGVATQTNSFWSAWCTGGICSWVSPLYCFQQ